MANIPSVSGNVSVPSFIRVPAFKRPRNPESGVPSELQFLGSAVAGAQIITGSGGAILPDTEIVIARDTTPGATISIPRFITSDIGGRGATRRIVVDNEGPEKVTVTAPPGVTLGGSATSNIITGAGRVYSSVPTEVGVAVSEYAISIA